MFVVTGATSGIGKAAAIALAERSLPVLGVGRRSELLSALDDTYPTMAVLSADLGTNEGIASVVSELGSSTVTGIVHAAGSAIAPLPFSDIDPSSLLDDMAVHLAAPIALNQQLRPARAVFIDSYSSNELRVGWSGYSIVKAATQMAARACAEELEGVRAIRAFPGAVRTPLVEAILAAFRRLPHAATVPPVGLRKDTSPTPRPSGTWIADLLVSASDEDLDARATWQFGEPM